MCPRTYWHNAGIIYFLQEVLLLEKIVASGSKTSYPVTLELGGKNPCIIDETAKLAAKKLFGENL
jgi:acyl-CoA reductase-like NAD-dependent aldehyde dehydrogenase